MSTVEEIQSAIESLPKGDWDRLRTWVLSKDDALWDAQFKDDATNGRLDSLAQEALEELKQGNVREL